MALQTAYERFLRQPTDEALAADASLHYITTLTSYHGAADIVKHLATQRRLINKKTEKVLSAIESPNALALEVETQLEFLAGGDAYLLNLDDNFLADRTVSLPIVHFVNFDGHGKVAQVRQHWDQGSLLKQLEVMGRSGLNWPIRDGKAHIKLITASVGALGGAPVAKDEVVIRSRSQSSNATRDPHASLSLFKPFDPSDVPVAIPPRGMSSTKPPPRDLNELFVGHDENAPSTPSPANFFSPTKGGAGKNFRPSRLFPDEAAALNEEESLDATPIAPKGGAGKNFQPSRIFDAEQEEPSPEPEPRARDTYIRPHPTKYQHFDFGDGSDPQDTPQQPVPAPTDKKSKHTSQWDFSDFVTPQKVVPSKMVRTQDIRHWGDDDDVVASPIKAPRAGPRRDAETHFEFVDDGGDAQDVKPGVRPRGSGLNNGLGLYQNNLYNEDGTPVTAPSATPTGGIAANLKDRSKDFEAHFTMTDEYTPVKPTETENLQEGKKKAVKMMNASWDAYDESPVAKEHEARGPLAESTNRNSQGISINGNGMGGRKGLNPGWALGDEEDAAKPVPSRKQNMRNQPSGGSFWDF